MDDITTKRLKSTAKKILKNGLPYGISTRLFPSKPILEGEPPEIYNKTGERVLLAYLQDIHILHSPYTYTSGRNPQRVLWDRYNYTLNTQFYTNLEIFKRYPLKDGQCQFGMLVESENVVPDDYDAILKKEDSVKSLSLLFTHSDRLLDKYENARFIPGGCPWYGSMIHGGGEFDDIRYTKKTKLISIVSSIKYMRPLSKFRSDLALEMNRIKLGDAMGTIVGKWVNITDSLDDYMYSVGIENTATKYYFTEKLLNCFCSQTIPVYYGASEFGGLFNTDGIIFIKEPTVECAIKTIKEQCSPEDYKSRLDAIIDNYHRVQKFLSLEDYLTDNYMDHFVF
jgi:hypothetical protein